jgi:hypothetical protein
MKHAATFLVHSSQEYEPETHQWYEALLSDFFRAMRQIPYRALRKKLVLDYVREYAALVAVEQNGSGGRVLSRNSSCSDLDIGLLMDVGLKRGIGA